MTDIPANIASNLAQRLVNRAIIEAKYLCCFKSYVENFEKEKKRLSAAREGVRKDIEEAKQRNENRIEDETQQWINEVDNLTQEDTQEKKKWFFGLCTDCIWQYGRGKELARKTLEIPKLMERRNNLRVARPVGPVGVEFHCLSNFMHFESRKAKFEELKEALKNSNNYLIGLQGMGGTGKTTMATQVGKEVEESKLFDKVIFTVVSNPPNVEKIRSDVARHLGLPLAEGKESKEHAESLWSRITNGGEKILIILDDVWERELDLKSIGIPVGLHDKGCCSVLLTTRDMKVCKAMGCQETIQIDVLPNEEALNLFLSHAVERGVDSSGDFEDVALDIVKWCGGLPVAIEAIAKSIKSESLQVWKDTSTALQNFDPMLYDDVDGAMRKAYNCLKLSYDNLKNEKAQELFLLCSLFPEDFEIPVELLSRIAIGLGLCGEVDEYNKARRQVFDVLLLEDEEENVKMHDLVHEVAIKIANKYIQVVRDSKTTLKENVQFSFWIDGFPNCFEGSKLEILIIFITSFVEFPDSLFEGLKKLRVLVINSEGWEIRGSFWVKSIQSLVNIRTLRLAYLKLEDISCMGNLRNLETLELFRCSIVELPNEITKLENLKLLGLAGCTIERNNPFKVIERCLRLEELYYRYNYDIFHKKMEYDVRDIGIPPKLQMYDIIGEVNHFPIYYLLRWKASLLRRFKPSYLQNIFSEATFNFLAAKAEILKLDGDNGTGWTNLIPHIAPIEDGGMNDLIKLSLKSFLKMECLIHTKNIGSEVTIFAKLVKLKLSTMSVKELCCGPFPTGFLKKLEKLHLNYCSNLEGTLFKGKLDLGKLKCIKLEKCSMSSLFHPSTAQSLKQLEKLEIGQCRELKYIISNEGLGQGKVEDDLDDPNEMKCCHHPMSPMMKKSSTTKDDLKVKDPSLSCSLICCFMPKSTATNIDNPIVSEEAQPNRTGLQELKTQVFNPAKCFLRPPLDPRNLREIIMTQCSNFTWLFTLSIASSMPLLEELQVGECNGLKHLFTNDIDDDDHKNFSFCKSLEVLRISGTPKLRYVLGKSDCDDNLSHQSQLAQESHQDIPNKNTTKCLLRQPLLHLTEMTITSCSNWTSLFTLSIASSMSLLESLSFNHLKSVRIIGVNNLRYVFGKCCCEDNLPLHNQNVEIHLPALQVLYLKNAPNMVSIGTQNCDFTALSLETVDSPPSLAGVFQGINFKTNIPPNSSTKIDDDNDDEYSKESHKEVVEYNGNPASETNSQLQEGSKAQVAMSKKKLSPSQSKQEVVENELAIQMKKNNTPTLAKDNFLHFQVKFPSLIGEYYDFGVAN
ncbi:putative disease resistance protein [Senna tora]|uniref:Putative disease resistance protein n=1 Tax=Senna tora TaxID=362788 RepID=A0A835CKP4_9FABA|nr:putative disease resistance protein [Senna tora]